MAEFVKDGFTFFDGFFNEPVFNFDSVNIEDKILYIKDNTVRNISFDSTLVKFDFLKELNFIEEIYISDNINVNELYYLEGLKRIVVNIKKGKPNINYSKFKELEILSTDWYNKFPDLSKNIKLKELTIWKFKPKEQTFKGLALPPNLESLQITESNILNFDGLVCPNLKIFEGHHCNKLESLTDLSGINNIETFILDHCIKLNNYDDLKLCKQLRKIILGDCGNIATLNWLKLLKNVKHFSFWNTKLLNGDTSPCFGIDYVSFKDSAHYNHKLKEFRKE